MIEVDILEDGLFLRREVQLSAVSLALFINKSQSVFLGTLRRMEQRRKEVAGHVLVDQHQLRIGLVLPLPGPGLHLDLHDVKDLHGLLYGSVSGTILAPTQPNTEQDVLQMWPWNQKLCSKHIYLH